MIILGVNIVNLCLIACLLAHDSIIFLPLVHSQCSKCAADNDFEEKGWKTAGLESYSLSQYA